MSYFIFLYEHTVYPFHCHLFCLFLVYLLSKISGNVFHFYKYFFYFYFIFSNLYNFICICWYIKLFLTNPYTSRNHFYFLYHFCNNKLNNIGDKVSPWFRPVLFSKNYYNFPSILRALLVLCTLVLHIF